jgi:hypothetical protein
MPNVDAARAHVRKQVAALTPDLRQLEPATRPHALVASDGLTALVERLAKEAAA